MKVYVKMWDNADKKYKDVLIRDVTGANDCFEPGRVWPCYRIESIHFFSNYTTVLLKHKEV